MASQYFSTLSVAVAGTGSSANLVPSSGGQSIRVWQILVAGTTTDTVSITFTQANVATTIKVIVSNATAVLPMSGVPWATADVVDGTSTSIFIRSGSVSVNGGPAINWPGGNIIPLNPFFGGRIPSGMLAFSFVPNGTHQLYVDGTTGNIAMAVSSPGASFPAGSLPLYVITTDGVNRFQNVADVRSSTAGMRASMEVVSNTVYRASYQNSFALGELTAQNGGAYAFQIGTGTVSVTVNDISFTLNAGGGWFEGTQTYWNAGAPPSGNTVQFYVNAYGEIENRATSTTQFQAGSLPLAVLTLDAVGRILTLDDYVPSVSLLQVRCPDYAKGERTRGGTVAGRCGY